MHEQYGGMLQYNASVDTLIEDLRPFVEDDSLIQEARELANANEAPLGLGILAWHLVDNAKPAPRKLLERIIALTDGISEPGVEVPLDLLERVHPSEPGCTAGVDTKKGPEARLAGQA